MPVHGVEGQNDEQKLLAELGALIKENEALSVFNQEAEESMKELTEDLGARYAPVCLLALQPCEYL